MICIIIIILLLIITFLYNKPIYENFNSVPLWYPNWISNFKLNNGIPVQDSKISNDCYKLSNDQCLVFPNCGLCINDSIKCVPGDYNGPFFTSNCKKWTYTDYYDKYIFGEKETRTVDPRNITYTKYKLGLPTPIIRSLL